MKERGRKKKKKSGREGEKERRKKGEREKIWAKRTEVCRPHF